MVESLLTLTLHGYTGMNASSVSLLPVMSSR
jgi:hypothetical protein